MSAHTQARGWSFLVARGRRRGYRTVLAPDFLARHGLHGILSEASSGDDLPPGCCRVVELLDPRVGPMTLSFTTEQIDRGDLGDSADGADPPSDEHGRPLEILYGVVARARLSGPVADDGWRRARVEALSSYRRFLDDEDGFTVDVSRPFALQGLTILAAPDRRADLDRPADHAGERPATLAQAEPVAAARPQRPAVPAVAVAALIAVLAVLLWPRPAELTARIEGARVEPASGVVDCGVARAVKLTGVISANRAATVTYHWERAGRTIAKGTLKLRAAGSGDVSLAVAGPLGTAPKGSFALVIDTPRDGTRAIRESLRCRPAGPGPSAPADAPPRANPAARGMEAA